MKFTVFFYLSILLIKYLPFFKSFYKLVILLIIHLLHFMSKNVSFISGRRHNSEIGTMKTESLQKRSRQRKEKYL